MSTKQIAVFASAHKRKNDRVTFEDNFKANQEESKGTKGEDLHTVLHNIHINEHSSQHQSQQEFNNHPTSNPIMSSVSQKHLNSRNSTNKPIPSKIAAVDQILAAELQKKQHEQKEKVNFKRVIDGLDLWSSELAQAKSQAKQISNQIIIPSILSNINNNNNTPNKVLLNNKGRSHIKNHSSGSQAAAASIPGFLTPNLNTQLIDLIMRIDVTDDDQKKVSPSESNQYEFVQHDEVIEAIDGGATQRQKSSDVAFFPRSMQQIPTRPVTLVSMRMREVDHQKSKGVVSRYSVDSNQNLTAKSDSQFHAEQNHEIVNNLFKLKVQRAIEEEKPANKDEYNEIVLKIAKKFKTETLSHFKNLSNLAKSFICRENVRFGDIEYEKLYEELFEDTAMKKQFGGLADDEQEFKNTNRYNVEIEKAMVKEYVALQKRIREEKEKIKLQRSKIANIAVKKKQFELDSKRTNEELDRKLKQFEYENVINQKNNRQENDEYSKIYFEIQQQINAKISRAQTEKQVHMNAFNKKISIIISDELEYSNTLSYLINLVSELKTARDSLRFQLKAIYLKEMISPKNIPTSTLNLDEQQQQSQSQQQQQLQQQEQDYTPQKSLIQTILKLFAINEEVTYNLFPEHLDEASITFLIDCAKLEQQILTLKDKITQLTTSISSKHAISNKELSSSHSQRNSLQITNKSLNKQPTLVSSSPSKPARFSIVEAFGQEEYRRLDRPVLKGIEEISKKNPAGYNTPKEIEEKIRNIQDDIETLKDKEAERIFEMNIKDSLLCKNIFYSLFGSSKGEKYLFENQRKQQKNLMKIAATHTFKFQPPSTSSFLRRRIAAAENTNDSKQERFLKQQQQQQNTPLISLSQSSSGQFSERLNYSKGKPTGAIAAAAMSITTAGSTRPQSHSNSAMTTPRDFILSPKAAKLSFATSPKSEKTFTSHSRTLTQSSILSANNSQQQFFQSSKGIQKFRDILGQHSPRVESPYFEPFNSQY